MRSQIGETGACTATLEGHSDVVNFVVFSPSGRPPHSVGSADKTVKLWNAKTGDCTATFKASI